MRRPLIHALRTVPKAVKSSSPFSMSAKSATKETSTRKRARVSMKHPSRCEDAYRTLYTRIGSSK
jgi:hypothetical protein